MKSGFYMTYRRPGEMFSADFLDFCKRAGMTRRNMRAAGLTGPATMRERYDAAVAIRRALRAGNFHRCLDIFDDDPCANFADFICRVNIAVDEAR